MLLCRVPLTLGLTTVLFIDHKVGLDFRITRVRIRMPGIPATARNRDPVQDILRKTCSPLLFRTCPRSCRGHRITFRSKGSSNFRLFSITYSFVHEL
ncbi:hypothetical protein NPIL_627241 [Nephila pilipes]|uniref:Uncharacterized protein n=1 Tax=Nephila pilipes TaxID=299642 RepID=A0A8X6N657_NEPPI|nr:hypothetical protein NPIL_627241 [Nephila pilipes]